ncbi:MAG: nucleoid-associated protein, partial [Saprospiraceae bacterium]|nr:nucleoid-associated protein [Saprospiraceae bacterium]
MENFLFDFGRRGSPFGIFAPWSPVAAGQRIAYRMIDFSATRLSRFAATWVGNKNRYEGVVIPKHTLMPVHAAAEELLITAFLKPFEKTEEFFYFHHEEDVSMHPVYQACMEVFTNPEQLAEQAVVLTQLLYGFCENPKVQGGEFFLAHFEDLMMHGEPTSAIGLWKVDQKEPVFKTERTAESFTLNILEGIPSGKPQVAAIIFNLDEAEGYRICAVDTATKKDERSFWKDDFLRLRPIEDNYFNTRHHISLASEFISQKAPFKFGLDRTETIDLLNRSGEYFKENDLFEVDDFTQQLFPEEEQRDAFKEFRDEYARAYAVPLEDKFDISTQAVKKESKVFKSVLKLDKNFHIYVHGRRDLIERGFDE